MFFSTGGEREVGLSYTANDYILILICTNKQSDPLLNYFVPCNSKQTFLLEFQYSIFYEVRTARLNTR